MEAVCVEYEYGEQERRMMAVMVTDSNPNEPGDDGECMSDENVAGQASSSALRPPSSRGVRLLFLAGLLIVPIFQTPTGEEILRRCEKNLTEVEDYIVDLEATVNMERLRMPDMKATMYFKKPDKVRFKSEGFMMLPREGFGVPVATLRTHYDATVSGVEEMDEKACYRLQLTAKNPAREIQSIAIWVNRENFTIVRTSTLPYRGRSVTIRFEYGRQGDNYWLPAKLVADFSSTQPDTSEVTDSPIPMKPQLQEFRRPPRNGSIEIRYLNYRVNTGLSDDIFHEGDL